MRTAKQIVKQTNEIARIIYASRGYTVPAGFEFHTETVNRHPHERQCWSAACKIQELLTETDVMNAVDEMEEEQ